MTTPRNLLVALFITSALPAMAADQPAGTSAPAPVAASASASAAATPATTATTAGSGRGRGGPRAGGPNTTMGLPPTVAPDAKVEKLATLPTETYTLANGFRGTRGAPFTEGATCAPNGDVYFVEQDSSKIMKWSVADKALSVFMHPSGFSNGMSFDYNGNLIACADERNELWSISIKDTESVPYPAPLNPAVGDKPKEGNITLPKHTVIMDGHYQGKLLGGPNDVWIRPDGGLYFTDPFYPRNWWAPGRTDEQDTHGVYFLSPDRKTLTRVINDFMMPNGIAGTSDGKTLFVADINARQTWAYDIQKDGSLTNKKLACSFGSDGMTLDDQGNLYMSNGPGVLVVSTKTGQQIGFIPVPEGPANMCFGGKDRSTLYITARTGFYSIPTKVKGANPGK